MLCSAGTCSVRACCCGLCSLKTGCFINGSIQFVLGLIVVILDLILLIGDVTDSIAISVVDLLMAAVILLLGIVLIHGTRKGSPAYLKVWFYTTLVMIITEAFLTILSFILGDPWLYMLPHFIIALVCIYFLIVGASYYHVLQGDFAPTSA